MSFRRAMTGLPLMLGMAITCLGQGAKGTGCLQYEPVTARLTGTLVRQTFPGPPNYRSISRGDNPETAWLLVLAQPVCVDEDKAEPDLGPSQKDVRRVQLVLDEKAYTTHKDLVGKRIVATGTLFGAHTGHHHTPVLLTVGTLAKAE